MNMMKSQGMTRHTVSWPERKAIIPILVGTEMNCDARGGRVAGMRRTCDVRRMGRCAVDVPPSRNAAVASHRGSLLIIFTNLNVARLQTKSLCRCARGAHGFGSWPLNTWPHFASAGCRGIEDEMFARQIRIKQTLKLEHLTAARARAHLHVRPTRVTIV